MDKSAIYRALGKLDVLAEYSEGIQHSLIVEVIETIERAMEENICACSR